VIRSKRVGLWVGAAAISVAASAMRPARLDPRDLAHRFDFEEPLAVFTLPSTLDEVSGLAFFSGERLLAHNDEVAVAFTLDPVSGAVTGTSTLGTPTVRGDFEGIAVAGSRAFLITSSGILYAFQGGSAEAGQPYRTADTGLGDRCEAEGLAYDAGADELLVACKRHSGPDDVAWVYRVWLGPGEMRVRPVRIPLDVSNSALGDGFHPSGIEVDPMTGTLVLVSAREEAIMEVTPDGRVLSAVLLRKRRHPQPEGIAFDGEGNLYVADEAHGRQARLTVYRRILDPGAQN